VRKTHGSTQKHRWIIEPIDGVNVGTTRDSMTPEALKALDSRYSGYAAGVGQHGLLFVDTFTAARVPAINKLGPLADVIAIHDTEASHACGYGYYECEALLSTLYHYSYRPEGHTEEFHRFTATDIFSRIPLDVRALSELAASHAISLWGHTAPLHSFGRGATGWHKL
jgi:hypothetical protein